MDIMVPLIVAGVFAVPSLLIALVVVAVVFAHRQDKRRMGRLTAYAFDTGWQYLAPPVPAPVGEAARSRRTRLALARPGEPAVWLVWHRWTEGGGDNSSTENRTFYYLWLGLGYADVRVSRRTSIGAFFAPVRGVGTGDSEFDKRFVIKSPAPGAALMAVTPAARQAMMSGHVANWSITNGTLVQTYTDSPTAESLQPRVDLLVYLARLITSNAP